MSKGQKKPREDTHVDRMYVCSPPDNACGGCFSCSLAGRKATGFYAGASYGCLSLIGLLALGVWRLVR